MAERFVASEQYDDLKGTVAIDGNNGAFLHDLRKYTEMPPEYWPVGLGLHRLVPYEPGGKVPFALYGVRCEQAGKNVEEIIRFANHSDEFPIYRFSGEIDPEILFAMIKRIDIKLLDRTFSAATNVVAYEMP